MTVTATSPVLLGPCRGCGGRERRTILSFGESPLAEVLLDAPDPPEPEPTFPLELAFCPDCALVHLVETVDPQLLYGGDYPYYSSVSPGLVRHFQRSAEAIIATRDLGPTSLVVEAASNDGHMLLPFVRVGIPVLGIDPAHGPAEVAVAAGVPTLVDYFGVEVAERLAADGKRADVLLGNNVLNLLEDPDDFAGAVAILLAEDGICVIEVPDVVATVDQGAFDNVFHQNVTYWSATSADRLFRRHGLFVTDVEAVDTFGGSLRLSISRVDRPTERLRARLRDEHDRGVDTHAYYAQFAARAERTRRDLDRLLRDLRDGGARIAAYGAAGGMATTLLSFAGIDHTTLAYAVDINPHKHGRYTAGSRLRIEPPTALLDDPVDYVLLCAWNYEPEVLEQQSEFRRRGGRFIVPVPTVRIV